MAWPIGSSWVRYDEKIINSVDHKDFPNPEDFICIACGKGRLITRPSLLKISDEAQKWPSWILDQKDQVDYVNCMTFAAKSEATNQQLEPCSIAYCKMYPTQVNCTSPIWLLCEKESISHLPILSCVIYVLVSPYQRTPKKSHKKLGCMSLWLGIFMRLGTLIAFPSIRGS
jgi:hypothetical protein